MNRDMHNIISREYERRQKRSADMAQQRKSELYTQIPRLLEIDDQINQMGIKYNRLILSANGETATLLFELKKNIDFLTKEKAELLKSNAVSVHSLKPECECSKCFDTGYITGSAGSTRCSCYKQQVISHLFSKSNISLTGNECFANFSELLYPDEIDQPKYGIQISPRENINNIRNACIEFAKNIDNPTKKNLYSVFRMINLIWI